MVRVNWMCKMRYVMVDGVKLLVVLPFLDSLTLLPSIISLQGGRHWNLLRIRKDWKQKIIVMHKFIACFITSGKYFKWVLKSDRLGEELEVHFLCKELPNCFSIWMYHFVFPLEISETSSCFTFKPAFGFVH